MWKQYLTVFSERGWNAYAVDLRGHGKSGGTVEHARMEDYVDDVALAIAELTLESPHLVGHSMGGLVALRYATTHPAQSLIAIDPSPSKEVQGEGSQREFPLAYSPMDAGMPSDPAELAKAFPDLTEDMLTNMHHMLGPESGIARSERKAGISVPKDTLSVASLFVGSELGESVPFGIGIRTARAMATYYDGDALEIPHATHPGILLGTESLQAAQQCEEWLTKHDASPRT